MTITELKNKIVKKLSEYTIDDYIFDANLKHLKSSLKDVFEDDSDDGIESYLKNRYPETYKNGLKFFRKDEIQELQNKQDSLKKELESKSSSLTKNLEQLTISEESLTQLYTKETDVKKQISENQNELDTIRTLLGKAHYDDRNEKLLVQIKNDELFLKSLPDTLVIEKNKLNQLNEDIKSLKIEVNELNSKINLIINEQENLLLPNSLSNKPDESHYEAEKESLIFLFILLLKKSIVEEEVIEVVDLNEGGNHYSYGRNVKETKTGEWQISYFYEFRDVDEYSKMIMPYFKRIPIEKKDWKKFLYDLINKPVPDFNGTVLKKLNRNWSLLENKISVVGDSTLSSIMALRNALRNNQFISRNDNTYLLYISGGISAKIVFRNIGECVSKLTIDNPSFYWLAKKSDSKIVNLDLYHISSYADSSIQIQLPYGFYILTKEIIIELTFVSTPILMDNNSVSAILNDNSSILKTIAEALVIAQKEQEEQDYWDDFYDD
jgi:hypothetical protein